MELTKVNESSDIGTGSSPDIKKEKRIFVMQGIVLESDQDAEESSDEESVAGNNQSPIAQKIRTPETRAARKQFKEELIAQLKKVTKSLRFRLKW